MRRHEPAARMSGRLGMAVFGANLTGAFVVYVFLSYLLVTPVDLVDGGRLQHLNTLAFIGYMAATAVGGQVIGLRLNRRAISWLTSDAPAGPEERTAVLRAPLHMARMSAGFWVGAAVLFGLLNASFSVPLAIQVLSTVLLGGVTTVSLAYLLAERVLRPAVTRAHAGSPAAPPVVLSVTRRMVLAWVVGSGVPLLGIVLGHLELAEDEPLGPAGVLFLVGVGLVVGLLATVAAARAVADPVQSVAAALREVGQGRLDTAVPVYDASEVGQLQAGFNAMADGLRERARLQDLFGRQVGSEVSAGRLPCCSST